MTKYLTTKEAAERLRISAQVLRLWRLRGVGPKFTKPSRSRCLYSEDELSRFLEARTYSSTSEESVHRDSGSAA
jgi:DNA-binding transcriptional MerR regulator